MNLKRKKRRRRGQGLNVKRKKRRRRGQGLNLKRKKRRRRGQELNLKRKETLEGEETRINFLKVFLKLSLTLSFGENVF